MKTKLLIVSALAAALQLAPLAYAQTPDAQEKGVRDHGRHGRHGRVLANLTPDERTKLKAANQKVMADPAVKAAKDRARQATKEFRDLKRSKLLQADPTLQPVLDKIPERGRGRDRDDS